MQSPLKDGRVSLYLEYYLGRSETPVLDENGNQVFYTDGAMKGKPKYKVKHSRKKENLNLYLYAHPKDLQERIQNRNTLALAEKTRYEREQRFLEDREGYKFKRDTNFNFLDYYEKKIKESHLSKSSQAGALCALRHFKSFLSDTPRYSIYSKYIRPEQLSRDMIEEFAKYLRSQGNGNGPKTYLVRFKQIVNMAFEEGLIKTNPCEGVTIKDTGNHLTKDILSLEEIEKLINTHYVHENSETQRAFLLTLFTGIRFCDVSRLTFRNIDYSTRTMRYTQNKVKNRSSHCHVVVPLNDQLIELIGYPPEDATPDTLVFDLPGTGSCRKSIKTWVRNAGIKKNIAWHNGRHSFAVNALISGADIKTVSSLLGHSSILMTEKYLHVVDCLKAKAIDNLGPIGYRRKYDSGGMDSEKRKALSAEYKATGGRFGKFWHSDDENEISV